ncbi:LytTR family DNA-binding domain-containing protein [Brevundimonas sp.]|uniref:LytTR family DNA-binding domain-containing protein n=1 Tax=Brevundimonas sp. TaxID=1871086 RepID=UPI003F71B207
MTTDSVVQSLGGSSTGLFGIGRATLRRLAVRAALALAFGVALALLEPFGLGEDQVLFRLGFWTAMMAVWFLLFSAIDLAASRIRQVDALHPLGRFLLIAGLAAVPMMVISQSATPEGFVLDPLEIVEGLGQVTLIAGAFEGLTAMIFARWFDPTPHGTTLFAPVSNAAPEPSKEALPPLVQRLPFGVRGPVICLQMEDHYVRIHTTRGSGLVLMRLSDAIAELQATPGLRVHRSWWIATEAVRAIDRSPRAVKVHLANGVIAPVSRPYMQALFAAADV